VAGVAGRAIQGGAHLNVALTIERLSEGTGWPIESQRSDQGSLRADGIAKLPPLTAERCRLARPRIPHAIHQ